MPLGWAGCRKSSMKMDIGGMGIGEARRVIADDHRDTQQALERPVYRASCSSVRIEEFHPGVREASGRIRPQSVLSR